MHIVYLLTHKKRKAENNPPYMYIGSKWHWKGEGTYYSSSRHPLMKTASVDDLQLEVLWSSETCTLTELHDKEKEFQLREDVINNPLYFNQNIANSFIFTKEARKKAVNTFKKVAYRPCYDGMLMKDVWAKKAKESFDIPDENGLTRREKAAKAGKEIMSRVTDSGELYSKMIARKTRESLMKVGEDGLTGYQRQGRKRSARLNALDPVTGRKFSSVNSTRAIETRFLGEVYKSRADIERKFGIQDYKIDEVLSGVVTQRMFNKLSKTTPESELMKYVSVRKTAHAKGVEICGMSFKTLKEAAKMLGVGTWSIEKYSKDGTITSALRKALENINAL